MKAVIYDKWLSSLGGGEVVACNMAQALRRKGYKVLFVAGKKVSKSNIFEKLKVNVSGIEFIEIWNDEIKLKKIVEGSDLFINTTFMDYSRGYAKKNIYYTHFPNKSYNNFRGMIFSNLVLPFVKKFIKSFEAIDSVNAPTTLNNSPIYSLSESNKYAISQLTPSKKEKIEFLLFIEYFDKQALENIVIELENGRILNKAVRIDHNGNTIHYALEILPKSNTVYLIINIDFDNLKNYNLEKGSIYLLYPKIYLKQFSSVFLGNMVERIRIKLRAGIFVDLKGRLNTYQRIVTHSGYVKKWIRKYWNKEPLVLYPPVDLLFKKYNLKMRKKKNWICSVGRFFTLGHGKKQEVLVEAFKRFYDKTKDKWELHLVGGLGDESSSIAFFRYLREVSKGYPIYFHIDASAHEVEEVYLKSKIYWHATGFGENPNTEPVKFEHFGIAPIEAMSAGCIPVLYNGGGLREIIQITGLNSDNLFMSINHLVENTIKFANGQKTINWDKLFKTLDNNFSLDTFRHKFLTIVKELK